MGVLFHVAVPAHDLGAARAFYGGILGCREGRSDEEWVDFDLFGHQLTVLLSPCESTRARRRYVHGEHLPVRHFGLVLDWADWEAWVRHLRERGVELTAQPHVRFAGELGEQATVTFEDPSGNAIELKALRRPDELFERTPEAPLRIVRLEERRRGRASGRGRRG